MRRHTHADPALNPGRYKLPEELNVQIFEKHIAPHHFHELPPSETPTLTILMAQPGAGKSHYLQEVLDPKLRKEHGGYADIDSDVYKRYHPSYEQLMLIDDKAMTTCTGEDARLWMRQAYKYSRDNRLNALTQEIVTNPPFLIETVKSFKEAGFRIDLNALAVPEAVSRQGILARYVAQVLKFGCGRLTEAGKSTQSVKGMSEFMDQAHSENLIDNMTIATREGQSWTYDSSDFLVMSPSSTLEAIRNYPMNKNAINSFAETDAWLESNLDDTWREELSIIRALAKPLLKSTVHVK